MNKIDIASFSEVREHLRDKLDQVKKSGYQVLVTNEGVPDGYIISPEQYDKFVEAEEILKSLASLDQSMAEIKEGKTRPFKEGIQTIAEEIGVQLER